MIGKRITEFTFVRVVRSTHPLESPSQAFWSFCGANAATLAPEDAALTIGVSARAIYRWVEERKIHFRESAPGALVVCPRLLLEHVRTA